MKLIIKPIIDANQFTGRLKNPIKNRPAFCGSFLNWPSNRKLQPEKHNFFSFAILSAEKKCFEREEEDFEEMHRGG